MHIDKQALMGNQTGPIWLELVPYVMEWYMMVNGHIYCRELVNENHLSQFDNKKIWVELTRK